LRCQTGVGQNVVNIVVSQIALVASKADQLFDFLRNINSGCAFERLDIVLNLSPEKIGRVSASLESRSTVRFAVGAVTCILGMAASSSLPGCAVGFTERKCKSPPDTMFTICGCPCFGRL